MKSSSWTIAHGHVVLDWEREEWERFQPIDEGIGEELRSIDVMMAEAAVLRPIRVPLTDGQFSSLVSFTFNLGPGALHRSTLLRKVDRDEFGTVPDALRRRVRAGGRKLKGLVWRREAGGHGGAVQRLTAGQAARMLGKPGRKFF